MVDDYALMEAFADGAALVSTRHPEPQLSSLDLDEFYVGRNRHADWRRGDVADVYMGANSLLAIS